MSIRRSSTTLGLALVTLIGCSFPVAVKLGVEGVPPFLLTGLRFCLAGSLLFALMLIRRQPVFIDQLGLGSGLALAAEGTVLCSAVVY